MFGILKSGIKLGIGCFVTIVLLIALAAGAFYHYCGKKPAPRPRNSNRRAALSGLNHVLKRDAIAQPRILALRQQEREDMPAQAVVDSRVHLHAIEYDQG